MNKTLLTPRIYHKSLELDALSQSHASIEEAEFARHEIHRHVEMRSRILLCSHLYHYSENNFKEWDIGNFDIQAISGFETVNKRGVFKLVRQFEPSDFSEKDLHGYMPYANPEDEFSWSVLFKVKDSDGDLVDHQIMESAPMLTDDNDLAKTEYESLLYNFERSLKTDLNTSFQTIEESITKIDRNLYSVNADVLRFKTYCRETDQEIEDLNARNKALVKSLNYSVIPLGILIIASLAGHAFHLYKWMEIGLIQ